MYWYKSKFRTIIGVISIVVLLVCCSSCKPEIKETKFFDLKGYFTRDIGHLKKLNKTVLKTIIYNGVTESKTVKINNWDLELDSFIASDINRPAWKNSYNVTANDDFLLYTAKYPDLKVREMLIKKEKGIVKWILIYNKTPQNTFLGLKILSLYQTTEKLTYFPDSLYLIEKTQRVRLLGTNVYKVRGVIGR